MKFGVRVLVTRGGSPGPAHVPSCIAGKTTERREVSGIVIGARGNHVRVRLDVYDSPYDTEYDYAHGIWFDMCAIREAKKCETVSHVKCPDDDRKKAEES